MIRQDLRCTTHGRTLFYEFVAKTVPRFDRRFGITMKRKLPPSSCLRAHETSFNARKSNSRCPLIEDKKRRRCVILHQRGEFIPSYSSYKEKKRRQARKSAVCGTEKLWNSIPILDEVDDFKEVAELRNQENTESLCERRRCSDETSGNFWRNNKVRACSEKLDRTFVC